MRAINAHTHTMNTHKHPPTAARTYKSKHLHVCGAVRTTTTGTCRVWQPFVSGKQQEETYHMQLTRYFGEMRKKR